MLNSDEQDITLKTEPNEADCTTHVTLNVDHEHYPKYRTTSMNLELDADVDLYEMNANESSVTKSLTSKFHKATKAIKESVSPDTMSEPEEPRKNFGIMNIESDTDGETNVTFETFEIGEIDSNDIPIEEFGLGTEEYDSL